MVPVEDMGCESCAERLQSKLVRLEGVSKATVDFDGKQARVTYDPKKIRLQRIVEEINKLFQAGKPREQATG